MNIFDLMQPEDEESLEILLRPETVLFQSSETWLNFLSPFFSLYNAVPALGSYIIWGEIKNNF